MTFIYWIDTWSTVIFAIALVLLAVWQHVRMRAQNRKNMIVAGRLHEIERVHENDPLLFANRTGGTPTREMLRCHSSTINTLLEHSGRTVSRDEYDALLAHLKLEIEVTPKTTKLVKVKKSK